MQKILDVISKEMQDAFEKAGYEANLGRVTVSNRPDLCEYQCNGAMAGAKLYHKAPLMIAQDVAAVLENSEIFSEVSAVAPGFLNLKVKESFLAKYLGEMAEADRFGMEVENGNKKVVIDYGGPNVAKALHVGHLRSAIIGESIKRICKYAGNEAIGDIHMGDWGTPMGLVIYEVSLRQPNLPYFDDNYEGEYPEEAPFTIAELEEIYPTASGKSKEDPEYKEKAMEATYKLQSGVRGYRALWNHIMRVSVADLKRNYDNLNVSFELWKGESDVHDRIPAMVQYMKDGGYAYMSDGALVVDVKEETDTKEVPPCMILKSDGAALYNTTDLATIQARMEEIGPEKLIYLTDKRQNLYFEQVFRCARKTKLVTDETEMIHIGFGTMNGKDGKPYKTRSGGVPRLENLIAEINEEMLRKIKENAAAKGYDIDDAEAEKTAKIVGLAAIKYGDLSNQAAKDYIFDVDRFTSFEGDTGPYILYTIVRIKSILAKFAEQGGVLDGAKITEAKSAAEKELMMQVARFGTMMEAAYEECAPHRVCAYIYDLSNAFNGFYHDTKILAEEDEAKKASWIALLKLVKEILEACIDVLGFSAPDRM